MRAPGLTLWAAAAVLRASWAWSSVKVSGRAAKAVAAAARRAAFSGLDWSLARQSWGQHCKVTGLWRRRCD
jgi:hypothetical protein